MYKIASFHQVLDTVREIKELKRGFVTNMFIDENRINLWIEKNMLFACHYQNSVSLFKQNDNFYNLFFISTDTVSLANLLQNIPTTHSEKLLVADIVGKEPGLYNLRSVFEDSGFFQYTSLQRMSKSTYNNDSGGTIYDAKTAKKEQSSEILNLLQNYFDPMAEQLPLVEEINQWIDAKTIKVITEGNKIIGFVIYNIIGLTSYLRYWFVHPEHRNKRIGSTLLRTYFQDSINTQRQIFWVIQSNQNAINRYVHFGYSQENMIDYVMINKNMKYEGPDN